jgi:PKD domain-containing protein/galactose oxidase-like protein
VFWFTEGTWDAADQYLMFYGGDDFRGTNLQATEAYSGANWRTVTTSGTTPGPLDGPALAYDPAAHAVVMYGGLASYTPFTYTNLTYLYSGGVWSASQTNPSPPARLAGSMVYDAALGGVVLFGGYNNSDPTGSTMLNDLWLYKGGTWSQLPDAGPPGNRTWASLAYDPTLQKLVLYSGFDPTNHCLGDTWTYNGTWTQIVSAGAGPTNLVGTSFSFDPDLGHAVLSGGATCPGVSNTVSWTFNGTGWVVVPALGAPSPHLYGIAAWDPADGLYVVAGGATQGAFTDTLSTRLALGNTTGPSVVDVNQVASFHANASGGVPEKNFSWDWGDGTPLGSGPTAHHPYAANGTFLIHLQVTDATGSSVFWNTSILVTPALSPQIRASATVLDVGQNANFTASSSGGDGTPTYGWSFGDGSTAIGDTAVHAFSRSGNFTVTVTVTDSVGGSAQAARIVEVFPALVVTLSVPGHADAGSSVPFAATVAGGDAPVSYAWAVDDGANSHSAGYSHSFVLVGSHAVSLTVLDRANNSVVQTATIEIAPAVGLKVQGPSSIGSGTTGSWSAEVTGGTAPFVVGWSVPGVQSGNGSTASLSFASAGTYPIVFQVTDSANGSASTTFNVTVTSGSAPFGGSVAGVPTLALLAIGVVVAAVAVGALLLRRRRSPPSAP